DVARLPVQASRERLVPGLHRQLLGLLGLLLGCESHVCLLWWSWSLRCELAKQASLEGWSVVPGDDDLVVVPLLDVPEVGDDRHLELVGLPLAAELLLDRLLLDGDLAG